MDLCDAAVKLRSARVAPSLQRIAIYHFLAENRVHPTAEEVWSGLRAQYSTLSRTTVQNTLRLFARTGLAQELTIERGELRYDAETAFHAHLKCEQCGRVLDLTGIVRPSFPSKWESCIRQVAVDCRGICPDCRKKNASL